MESLAISLANRSYQYIPINPEAPVVPKYRIVQSKVQSATISKYQDDVWDLDVGIPQVNCEQAVRRLPIERFPEAFREVIRPYAWCSMNFDHAALPGNIEPVSPFGLRSHVVSFARYCSFMASRGIELQDVGDAENDLWMQLFSNKHYSMRVRAAAIPKRLYWYRHHLPMTLPDKQPWAGREPTEVLGKPAPLGENKTERVPRFIMDPMLRWAMFYVEHAYEDVFWLLRNPRSRRKDRPSSASHEFARLPGTTVQWRRVEEDYTDSWEAHCLVMAAYVVAAYLSGMRDGEVQTIKDGGWGVKLDEQGVPYRHWVKAIASFKGRGKAGKQRTWIVLPEVHLALERLSELKSLMRPPSPKNPDDADLLFRRYSGLKTDVVALGSRAYVWLKKFSSHANALAETAAAAAPCKEERDTILADYLIPATPDGAPWPWITKHFRRTIAWYIANEPFGTVAGMRQFGQVREATFQGYAGSAEAGFRDEVDRARAVGQERDLLEMYEDVRSGGRLGGPKGARLESEFQRIADELGDLPGKVVDEARLLKMLKNVAKEVYPGLVNDCFFDATTALCLRKPGVKARDRPLFAQCDWEKCPNSCFWRKHRQALADSLDEAREHRRRKGLSKNQRTALDVVIAKYRAALESISNAGPP